MIDYLFAFASEVAAQADPVIGAYYIPASPDGPGQWRGDICIPNVQVIVIATGLPLDSQWRLIIALPQRVSALDNHPDVVLIADRDAANAGAAPSQFVLYSVVPASAWPTLQISPVFAGSNYPFGTSV
jgi:hypothetical protein